MNAQLSTANAYITALIIDMEKYRVEEIGEELIEQAVERAYADGNRYSACELRAAGVAYLMADLVNAQGEAGSPARFARALVSAVAHGGYFVSDVIHNESAALRGKRLEWVYSLGRGSGHWNGPDYEDHLRSTIYAIEVLRRTDQHDGDDSYQYMTPERFLKITEEVATHYADQYWPDDDVEVPVEVVAMAQVAAAAHHAKNALTWQGENRQYREIHRS